MKNFELWTNPFDDDLSYFESQLKLNNIKFEREYRDGDETTCFYDGVVYTFHTQQDFDEADNLYLNI